MPEPEVPVDEQPVSVEPVADSSLPADPSSEIASVPSSSEPDVSVDASGAGEVEGVVPDDGSIAPAPSWVEQVRQFEGFGEFETPEQAQTRAVEFIRLQQEQIARQEAGIREMQPYAQIGFDLQNRAPGAPSPEPEPEPSAPTSWWSPPEYNEALFRPHLMPDPDNPGYTKLKPDAPLPVAEAYNTYHGYVDNWARNVLQDPQKVLPGAILGTLRESDDAREILREIAREEYKATQEQSQQEAFIQQFMSDNSDWMFQMDANGQYSRDPRTGQLIPSYAGQQFGQYTEALAAEGITDKRALCRRAIELLERDAAIQRNQQANVQPTAQQTRTQNQLDTLKRGAVSVPPQSGSLPTPQNPAPSNEQLTVEERFRRNLQKDGVIS
jgi:hypothetical protein